MADLLDDGVAMISTDGLDRLMPLFVRVAPSGHIRSVGPTMTRICGGRPLAGARFLEVFEIRKPQTAQSMQDLARLAGQRLHLTLRDSPRTGLRGLCVPLSGDQGFLVNLSFGIAVAEAVGKHALTSADFAPTDLTVELLYLTEVKAAVMEELSALNLRLQDAHRSAERQALSDALTGLCNRRGFDLALQEALHARGGAVRPFALMQIDLDFFKAVNDALGHAAGDLVLAKVATILRNAVRKRDVVARVGGDEFVLILHGPVDVPTAERIAERIIEGLEQPIMYEGHQCRISGSIGITLSSFYDIPAADRMLSDADAALYASKRRGRARHTVFVPGAQFREDDRTAC